MVICLFWLLSFLCSGFLRLYFFDNITTWLCRDGFSECAKPWIISYVWNVLRNEWCDSLDSPQTMFFKGFYNKIFFFFIMGGRGTCDTTDTKDFFFCGARISVVLLCRSMNKTTWYLINFLSLTTRYWKVKIYVQ